MQNVRLELLTGAALGAAMLIGSGLAAPSAQAGYIVTLDQVGNSIVATGSGTLDLASLTLNGSGTRSNEMDPPIGLLVTGPASQTPDTSYTGITGPTGFGSTGVLLSGGGSGDIVGIEGLTSGTPHGLVIVPAGYVSGGALSDTSTFIATLAGLGITPGTYEWTWGSGATADSFTIDV